MKKISLFSFLAAALLCVGQNAMAQTTIFHWQTDGVAPSTFGTAITCTGGTITPERKEGSTKTISAESAKYVEGIATDMKSTGDNALKCGTNDIWFVLTLADGTSFLQGDTLQICGYNPWIASSSSSNEADLCASFDTGAGNKAYNVGKAIISKDATSIYVRRASSTAGITAIKIVRPAPKTEPWISVTPAEVNLDVNPFAKSVEASVAIKGGNLTDGNYDLTLPTVEGLTIAPTSVTVTDGALDATITLTYTSETNVEAAAAEASLTIGELTEKLTINYSANVDLLEQTTVSENTTWDWSKAGAKEIKLTTTTAPKKNDTIVLANIDGIANNADFNSQALLVSGEYMVRDSKYFQGQYIAFKIEKAGTIQVEFCNTGNREEADRRYLCVNGTKTAFGSITTSTNTTSDAIDVPAGTVEISFANATTAEQYCRVYKIIYTKGTETSFEQAEVSAKAVKVVRDGQLYILRDGKTYNAQGIVVE